MHCWTRLNITRCILSMVLYLCDMCQCGLHAVLWLQIGVLMHLRATLLQNLAVPQDLYSLLSVPKERSCWPCIRWYGTIGFQEQGRCFFIGLSCLIPFCLLLFYLSLLSVYRLCCGAGVFKLIGCKSLFFSLVNGRKTRTILFQFVNGRRTILLMTCKELVDFTK